MFQTIKRSFLDREFYNEISNFSYGQSVKFFLKVAIIISLVLGIISGITAGFSFKFISEMAGKKVLSSFPEDLVITIKDKKVSMNKSEPLVIPFEKEVTIKEGLTFKNILVVDTNAQNSIDSYKNSQAFFVVSSTHIAYTDGDGQVVFTPVLADMVVNKSTINKILSYSKYIPFISMLLFITLFFFRGIFALCSLIIVALILYFVFKVIGSKRTYKESFIISLYASLLPFVVTSFLFIVFISIPSIFGFATLIIALWMTRKDSSTAPVSVSE